MTQHLNGGTWAHFLAHLQCGGAYGYWWTLDDVLGLAIVPLALAGGALWLNKQQKDREMECANNQANEAALPGRIISHPQQGSTPWRIPRAQLT
jgi:hypothetical protein